MIYMSYILVGLSFPMVFIMLTIVVMRLLFHGGCPGAESFGSMIASSSL